MIAQLFFVTLIGSATFSEAASVDDTVKKILGDVKTGLTNILDDLKGTTSSVEDLVKKLTDDLGTLLKAELSDVKTVVDSGALPNLINALGNLLKELATEVGGDLQQALATVAKNLPKVMKALLG